MPSTPLHRGTTPSRRAAGRVDFDAGEDSVDDSLVEWLDDDAARCKRCGRVWNGLAQCDCRSRARSEVAQSPVPSPVPPSSLGVPSPRLLDLNLRAKRFKERRHRDEFDVDVPQDLMRRSLALQRLPQEAAGPSSPAAAAEHHPVFRLLTGGAGNPVDAFAEISPTLSFQARVSLPTPTKASQKKKTRKPRKQQQQKPSRKSFKDVARLVSAHRKKNR